MRSLHKIAEEFCSIREKWQGKVKDGQLKSFLLVYLGERPGMTLPADSEEEVSAITDFLSCNTELYVEGIRHTHSYIVYVSESQEHLERFDPTTVEDTTENQILRKKHKTVGKFYGYADEAIKAFVQNQTSKKLREKISESVSTELQEERKEWDYVHYIPAPTEESFQKASEREDRYQAVLNRCDVDFELLYEQYQFE